MIKYKNKELKIEERVNDLLNRMTLKEKVGQLNQKLYGWNTYQKIGDSFKLTKKFKDEVNLRAGMGALYGLFRADPWSRVTFKNGIKAEKSAEVANMIQQYVIENTRLGIPVLISEECPHGHQALDGTVFPTNLGIASSWNPELYQKAMAQSAAEIRSRGAHLALISLLDILRDPRWGRSEECFSEDPYLAAQMTEAAVRGLQGEDLNDLNENNKVAAVMKHFCAQGACTGGLNAAPASIGERELREIHLPGVIAGIKAGALGIMAAYNEIDGIPCHANKYLLTDILREEFDFDGIVMADGTAVDRLMDLAGSYENSAALALKSGIDLSLWDTSFTKLEEAVKKNKDLNKYLDRAVARILTLKFQLGLFENPYTDQRLSKKVFTTDRTKKLNLQVARESVVLLKNKDDILPLSKNIKSIAVLGPNSNKLYNQLGDYTAPQEKDNGSTVLEGIRESLPDKIKVVHNSGCGIRNGAKNNIRQAIEIARKVDTVVVVLGGSSTRDFNTKFDINGAALIDDENIKMNCGEGVDLANIELAGDQLELIKEIKNLNKKVITVLIQGRPHAIPMIAKKSDALLCAWYPGLEGGRAVAEIIFGDYNPSAKLPVSIPGSASQLPIFYNHKKISSCYIDQKNEALYKFGHGLSYSEFKYSQLKITDSKINISELKNNKSVGIKFKIKNISDIKGAEVAKLYIQADEGSITRRVRELKAFKKVLLKPDEEKEIIFNLTKEELKVWNIKSEYGLEVSTIKIFVQGDSNNILEGKFEII